MVRLLKWIMASLSIAIIILLLSIVSFVTLLDPNHFKTALRQHLFEKTGLHLTIAGNLRWCLKPNFSLEVTDVKINHQQGFDDEFLNIPILRLTPKFNHVFKGCILADLETSGLKLNLKERENDNQWLNVKEALSLFPWVNAILLESSTIKYQNDKTDQMIILDNIYLSVQNINSLQETLYVPFRFSAQWQNKNKPIADLKGQGEWLYHSLLEQIDIHNVKIEVATKREMPTIIVGECRIEKPLQNTTIAGKLQVTTANLIPWITNIKLPDAIKKLYVLHLKRDNLSATIEPAKIDACIQYQQANLSISDFKIDWANGTQLAGNLTFQNQENLLKGQLFAKQIRLGYLPCPKAVCQFTINPSSIDIHQYEVQIAKSKNQGSLRITDIENIPKYQWINEMEGYDVDEVLSLLNLPNRLYGEVRLKTDLNTTGETFTELKKNLCGTATTVLQQGKIGGINLISLLNHTDATFKKLQDSLDKRQATNVAAVLTAELSEWRHQAIIQNSLTTPFDSLEANFKIVNGLIQNEGMQIKHPQYTLSGRGTLNLENNRLDLETHAVLQKDKAHSSIDNAMPLAMLVEGTLDNLTLRPGLAERAKKTLKLTKPETKTNTKALEKLFGFP